MRTTRSTNAGFSLLELMVVIGVMGILLAIVAPSVSGYVRSTRVQGSMRTLEGDLRQARALATAERHTFAVTVATGGYSLVRLSPASTVLSRRLPPGVTVVAPDTTLFFPWGLTEAATFTLTDAGRSSTLRLLSTGSVSHD